MKDSGDHRSVCGIFIMTGQRKKCERSKTEVNLIK